MKVWGMVQIVSSLKPWTWFWAPGVRWMKARNWENYSQETFMILSPKHHRIRSRVPKWSTELEGRGHFPCLLMKSHSALTAQRLAGLAALGEIVDLAPSVLLSWWAVTALMLSKWSCRKQTWWSQCRRERTRWAYVVTAADLWARITHPVGDAQK